MEELLTPPYPSQVSTDASLHRQFAALRNWVLHYREDINAAVRPMLNGTDLIPVPQDIPAISVYHALSVATQFGHLMTMRHIRQQWDELVRTHEDSWDSPVCQRLKAMILAGAATFMNGAFMDNETREALEEKISKRMRKSFEKLTKHVFDSFEPDEDEDEDGETE
jgi:ATP/maltotriose-dependent transcriptional regulator MalT